MATIGQTFFARSKAYLINPTTPPTVVKTLGEFNVYVPYLDPSATAPSTGNIINAGVPTSLYYEYLEYVQHLELLSFVGYGGMNPPLPAGTENFANFFPNAHFYLQENTSYDLYLENLDNGKFMCISGVSSHPCYASMSAFMNGDAPLKTSNSGVFDYNNNGSGATRGIARGLCYTQLNEDGTEITKIKTIVFYGATSTTNTVSVNSITAESNPTDPFTEWIGTLQPVVVPSSDPFSCGGTSDVGGGDGTFGDNRFGDGIDDEAIEIPDYDALEQQDRSVVGTGFVHVYQPTKAQLQAFKSYLWSDPDIGDLLKRMYVNPFDAVVSLHMVPVSASGISQNILIGGQDSGVASTSVSNQYVTVNCGSLSIGEFWDAYLDYAPYTKMYLYLPFCGMHEVDTDEFMGKTMSIRYDVDVVTGDCLASVSAVTDGGAMTRVLYQYQGNCAVEVPVSGQNYNAKVGAYMGLIGTAFGIGAGVMSGGLGAAAGVGSALSGAMNVVNAKGSIQRSGALSGSTAWMSTLKPYLIIVQPTQCLPDGQNAFTGYPSYITAAVSDLSGYTEFAEIHLAGISATDEEKAEIERIMKEGVLL